jgi:hypothetical protein
VVEGVTVVRGWHGADAWRDEIRERSQQGGFDQGRLDALWRALEDHLRRRDEHEKRKKPESGHDLSRTREDDHVHEVMNYALADTLSAVGWDVPGFGQACAHLVRGRTQDGSRRSVSTTISFAH